MPRATEVLYKLGGEKHFLSAEIPNFKIGKASKLLYVGYVVRC